MAAQHGEPALRFKRRLPRIRCAFRLGHMLQQLLEQLRREAGFENTSGAISAARSIAALPGEAPIAALTGVLEAADGVDLTDDAGDVGDEVFRLRSAAKAGLLAAGVRVVPFLRARLDVDTREPRHTVMLRVLGELGDRSVLPIAEAWSSLEENEWVRWAALETIGLLRVPGTEGLLRAALGRPGAINQGWLKRITAVALARLGDVEALEVLLDDPDWFARLGVAEGLKELPAEKAKRLRQRVERDVDARVRAAAKE